MQKNEQKIKELEFLFMTIANKKPTAILLLTGVLPAFFAPVLWLAGCAAAPAAIAPKAGAVVKNNDNYTAEPRYISPEIYQQLLYSGIQIIGLGEEHIIIDVQGKVESISSLYGIRAISFSTTQMPKDMERLLKRYKTDDEYDDYYNYVMAATQRVVLCPDLYFVNGPVGWITYGLVIQEIDPIYPTESTMYINMLYNRRSRDSIARLISDIVHETSHIFLAKLVKSGKLPEFYLSEAYTERYAYIRQADFLRSAIQDPEFYTVRSILKWHIDTSEKTIERYNTMLGFSSDDRTLFPR